MKSLIACALGAFAIVAAAAPALAGPADLASAAKVIDRVDADWLEAMKAKDGARLAKAYAPDGVFVLSNGQTIVGRAEIAAFYRARVAKIGKVLDGGIHRDGLTEAPGGLVYEWGHGGSTTTDSAGKATTSGGPYLTVWKRGATGAWTIIRNLVF